VRFSLQDPAPRLSVLRDASRTRTRPATYVSCVCGHDSEVVLVNDLLHLLDTSEVSQHVSDRNNVAVGNEFVGDSLGRLDGAGSYGLFDKVGGIREEFEKVDFKVGTLGRSTPVCRRATDDNRVRFADFGALEVCVVILDGGEDLGIPVCRLDEGSSLALEHLFCPPDGWVYERNNLETGTELVFQSEGVVPWSFV